MNFLDVLPIDPAEPPQGGVHQGLTVENEKMQQIW